MEYLSRHSCCQPVHRAQTRLRGLSCSRVLAAPYGRHYGQPVCRSRAVIVNAKSPETRGGRRSGREEPEAGSDMFRSKLGSAGALRGSRLTVCIINLYRLCRVASEDRRRRQRARQFGGILRPGCQAWHPGPSAPGGRPRPQPRPQPGGAAAGGGPGRGAMGQEGAAVDNCHGVQQSGQGARGARLLHDSGCLSGLDASCAGGPVTHRPVTQVYETDLQSSASVRFAGV